MWVAGNFPISEAASDTMRSALLGPGVFVSPVSAWEISLLASKKRLGALGTQTDAQLWFDTFATRRGVHSAPLTAAIGIAAAFLPGYGHRDPADRFLIATAREMDLALITRDQKILDYAEAGHVRCIPC